MAYAKVILLALLALGSLGHAQTIEFPQEELPNESQPPKLDAPNAVLGKAVSFTNRIQPNLSYGWLLDEAFYQNAFLSIGATYSWDENNGLTFRYMTWSQGISDYSKEFEDTASNLQFDRASGPRTGYSLSYDRHVLYGKISFAKNMIVHTRLSLVGEFGMIDYSGKSLPTITAGISNAWYFGRHWGAHLDLKGGFRQALDPLSEDLRSASPTPDPSDFGTTTKMSTTLAIGVHYLF